MRGWRNATLVAALVAAATVAVPPAPAAAETVRQAQWYLGAVRATQAQKVTKGDGVIVAVIDTGVDAGHPDLAGAVLPGTRFAGDAGADGRSDPQGHGTKMSGIIAARGGGENKALGIAPRARILPIAVPPESSGSLAGPIRWAVDHGAKVINLSIGRDEPAPADEVAAVAYAASKDVVLVAAAGNRDMGEDDKVNSPANLPGVIAVSGTARSGEYWSGSAYGPQVAVAAPAEYIVNATARNVSSTGYSSGGATSEATAIVSGVAALIRAKYPRLDAANVVNRLVRTAADKGDPGRDPHYGFGLVDAERAVTADVPAVQQNPLGSVAASPAPDGAEPVGAQPGPFGSPMARLGVVLGVVLLGLILLVVLIVLVTRRSSRRRAVLPAQAGGVPAGYPPPPVGRPGPPGYGPPPGYPPTPGQPAPMPAAPGYPPAPGQPAPPYYPPPGPPVQGQPGGYPPAGYPPAGYPPAPGQPPHQPPHTPGGYPPPGAS